MNDRSNASQINVTQMTSMADLAITLLDDNIIMFNSILIQEHSPNEFSTEKNFYE